MRELEDDERLVLLICADGQPRNQEQLLAYANELVERHGSCAAAADALEQAQAQKH
jgi:hypothetical protein